MNPGDLVVIDRRAKKGYYAYQTSITLWETPCNDEDDYAHAGRMNVDDIALVLSVQNDNSVFVICNGILGYVNELLVEGIR